MGRKILLQTFLAQRNCIFLLIQSLKIFTFQKISTFDVMTARTQLTGGGTKNQTKRVAQNTYSIKFSALQTPRKIQNSFLKRALIPEDYNTDLQIRDFWQAFS